MYMARIAGKVDVKGVPNIILLFLTAGVMINGIICQREEGTSLGVSLISVYKRITR